MEKIRNIEMLRFIFILQIMFMHSVRSHRLFEIFPDDVEMLKLWRAGIGYLCVDYFFIIAGFFLVYTFKDIHVVDFIKKKIARLLPEVAFLIISLFILSLFGATRFDAYLATFSLTFTGQLGFLLPNQLANVWFANSLFWGLLLYFYCIKHFQPKYNNLFFAVLVILSYAILFNNPGGFANVRPNVWGVFNVGTLRAIAGIGLGYFIGIWYKENVQKIKEKASKSNSIFFSTLEIFLLFFLIYFGSFHTYNHPPMFMIYVFIALFICFLFKRGILSKFLDNNFSSFLGKYVYTLYVVEPIPSALLKHFKFITPDFMGGKTALIIIMLAKIAFGIIAYYIIHHLIYIYIRKVRETYEKHCVNKG